MTSIESKNLLLNLADNPSRWSISDKGIVCDFDRHTGTPLDRIPESYLYWMMNMKVETRIARYEIQRRGLPFPELDISNHAIDRASQRLLKKWRSTRLKSPVPYEGIMSWLLRMAHEAIRSGDRKPMSTDHELKIYYKGIQFIFRNESDWPVLLTVSALNRNAKNRNVVRPKL